MNELVLALLTWIVGQTGLAMPPPPRIVLVSEEQMSQLASGHSDAMHLQGLYKRDAATIYLHNDWNPVNLRSRASLLHELVHHVQSFNRVPSRCSAELERQAYQLTLDWLREQGVADPYAFLNIDEFTIVLLSMCPEGNMGSTLAARRNR